MTHSERGRLGGLKTVERHGREHMSEIGKRGFAAICSYAAGGRKGALIRLSMWGRIRLARPTPELTPEQLASFERELGLCD